MTLRMRILIAAAAVTTCVLLLTFAALRGFSVTRAHIDTSALRSDQLRMLYQLGHDAALAQQALRTRDVGSLRAALERSARSLDEIAQHGDTPTHVVADLRRTLTDAQLAFDDPGAGRVPLTALLNAVRHQAGAVRAELIDARKAAAAHAARTERALLALVAVAVLLTIVTAITIHRAVVRPLGQLRDATTRIATGDFSERVPERGPGELRDLAQHFNRMADEIDALQTTMTQRVETQSRQLVRSEQLASVGHLAAGVAHEINNPLGIIAGYAERTLRRAARHDAPLDHATITALQIICDEAFRAREITGDLLRLARPIPHESNPVDLVPLVHRAVALAHGLPAASGRTIVCAVATTAPACIVRGTESQLIQVVLNLLANALESCDETGGRVVIDLDVASDYARLTVRDNGCGMDDDALRHAFDAFYTDKPSRGLSGTGLGLSISHAITQQHGGQLHAESDGRGHGCLFTLTLPRWLGAAECTDACA